MRSYAEFNRRLAKQYDVWMVAMHYAKQTQLLYNRSIHRYLDFLGKKSAATVTHTDIRRYIARVSEDGATLDSVHRDLGVLRQFYDFLNLGGVVNYVAPRFVRLRRPWRSNPRPLTEAQVRRFIAATRSLRDRALVEFFYSTGCRLSEAIHLRIEDVDLKSRTARVIGKLNKIRPVFLTKKAANALRTYIGDRQKGLVFLSDVPIQKGVLFPYDGQWKLKWAQYVGPERVRKQRTKCLGSVGRVSHEDAKLKQEEFMARVNRAQPRKHHPLSKVAVQTLIRKIAINAGLKNVTPHTFRRTFASHLYNHGASIEVIKALMGHVWISTTLKYTQIGPDRLVQTFDQCHPRGILNAEPSK